MRAALTPNAWLRWDLIQRELALLPEQARILEVGMGGGAMGARLAERHQYVGIEPDDRSRERARDRLGPASEVFATLADCPRDEPFAALCSFEVLEHIEDDSGALASWVEVLAPGGLVWLSVPAHQHRFGAADEAVGHLRRYSREQLTTLVRGAGLEPRRIDSVGFPVGNMLEVGRNLVARRRAGPASVAERTASSGRFLQPPEGVGALIGVAMAPARWLQRPFRHGERGPGWFAVARRPA
jgi:SAM-dependent methyltransferase